MIDYIKLVRPINLLIVFFTQFILYYFVVFKNNSEVALSLSLIILLSITTAIITACGYVINDYYDQEIDAVNKKTKRIIGIKISSASALKYYYLLLVTGFGLSCRIAGKTDNWHLLPIYPFAQLILFQYARSWKLKGMIGNLSVAFMTCFVSIIILVAERKYIFLDQHKTSLLLVISFGVFAFFINLMRELVKDIQDMEGDKIKGSKSLPLTAGITQTTTIVYFLGSLLIAILLLFTFVLNHGTVPMVGLFVIVFMILFSFSKLRKSNRVEDYKNVSSIYKVTMLAGLIYLLILNYYNRFL